MLINVGVYHVMILSITHLELSPLEAPQLFGAAPAASHGRCSLTRKARGKNQLVGFCSPMGYTAYIYMAYGDFFYN